MVSHWNFKFLILRTTHTYIYILLEFALCDDRNLLAVNEKHTFKTVANYILKLQTFSFILPLFLEFVLFLQLLLVRRPCANYHMEREKVFNSSEVQKLLKQYESLFKELTEITGQKTEDFDGVQDIYSTLLAEVR